VDIILVDETHSAVVHHTIPDGDNDVGADGEDSTPTFTIPPRTPSIDLLALHHKRTSKRRSRASQFSLASNGMVCSAHTGFTSFHTPASSFSDGHEPHHSALSSPLSRSCSARLRHRPPRLPQPQTVSPALGVGDVDLDLDRTITPDLYVNDLDTLALAKAARTPHGPKLSFTSAKTGVGC
jgi:Ras-related protein Rab-7A